MTTTRECGDLDDEIAVKLSEGFRLEMISPADGPREALLSRGDERIRLRTSREEGPTTGDWVTGRAGMMYRDLVPGRLGGNLIASHIRIVDGGEVADSVHFHKVAFQMIYCVAGRIRVVYEDQGPPFWLDAGDCVLQPPEIRHRVLECTANSEVIEVGVPAVHETWMEYAMELPTGAVDATRRFTGQQFVRNTSAECIWQTQDGGNIEWRDTGIAAATSELTDVRVVRAVENAAIAVPNPKNNGYLLLVVLAGDAIILRGANIIAELSMHAAYADENAYNLTLEMRKGTEVLVAGMKKYESFVCINYRI